MSRSKDKVIYNITIKNWKKYNSSLKRGHKQTMISNSFCSDAKLRTLPVSVRWMFLAVLLEAGNVTRECIEMTERQLRECLESSWSVSRALDALEELQILSYTKYAPNRIEKNRKEKNIREVTAKAVTREPEKLKTPSAKNKSSLKTEQNIKLWEAYKDAYFLRYGVNPVRNGKVNRIISQLRERLGQEAEDVVRFYLSHTKNFYISKLHDISYCLSDAESLRTQWAKGVVVTDRKVREFTEKLEGEEKFQEQIRKAREYDRQKDQDDHQQFLLERGEL